MFSRESPLYLFPAVSFILPVMVIRPVVLPASSVPSKLLREAAVVAVDSPSFATSASPSTETVKSIASRRVASPVRPLITTLYLRARLPLFLIANGSRLYLHPGSQRTFSPSGASADLTHLRASVSVLPSLPTSSTSRLPA